MMSKFSLVLILLFHLNSLRGQTMEFPKLCPDEKNLGQVCESLKKLDPSSKLIFHDGTEMPACLLSTQNNEQNKIIEQQKRIVWKIALKVEQHYPDLTDRQFQTLLRTPSLAIRYPHLTSLLKEYSSLVDQYQKRNRIVVSSKVNITEEASSAYSEIKELVKRQNQNSALSWTSKEDLQRSLAKTRMQKTAFSQAEITCDAALNAFYDREFGVVSITDKMSQFPKNSRRLVIAHEIGHSIASCSSGSLLTPSHPIFSNLVDCFQNHVGKFKNSSSSEGCEGHKEEAFCDHIGVYVLEQELKKAPNPRVDLSDRKIDKNSVVMPPGYESIFLYVDNACSQYPHKPDNNQTHPSMIRRLHDIVLRNPTIAKSVGCDVDPKKPYCDVEKGLVGGDSFSKAQNPNNRATPVNQK